MKNKFERINFDFKRSAVLVEDKINNMFGDNHVFHFFIF